jgi:RHS repeat-associated protein
MVYKNNNASVSFTFLVLLILLCQPVSFAAVNYYYDANGNMVRDTGVGRCYGFNDANQLSNITDCAGATLAQYWYDESGQRIKSVENGVTTYYPFPEYETQVGGSNPGNTSYFYVNGERVARKDPDGSMHYYSGNQLGSTVLVTNSTGVVEENTKYLPYGKILSGGTKTKYLFNSKELSVLSNLYYYGARYYNPELMRFIQPDGITSNVYDPQILNPYNYVKNNPLKYKDSSGHFIQFVVAVIGIGYLMGSALGIGEYVISHQWSLNINNREAQRLSMERGIESGTVLGALAMIEVGALYLDLAAAGGVGVIAQNNNRINNALGRLLRDNSGELRFRVPSGGYSLLNSFTGGEKGELLSSSTQLIEGGNYLFAENLGGAIKIGTRQTAGSHANLWNGKNVLTAGHIVVEDGKYNLYSASGHYQASAESLNYAKEYLMNMGVSASNIVLHNDYMEYYRKYGFT